MRPGNYRGILSLMKRRMSRYGLVLLSMLLLTGAPAQTPPAVLSQWQPLSASRLSSFGENRVEGDVARALLGLPYFGVFDFLSYRVDGEMVSLYGWVMNPKLRTDAERVVQNLCGVQFVNNEIRFLPNSPAVNRLRLAVYTTIYASPRLSRYALIQGGTIHIGVDGQAVMLEGTVTSETDRQWAAALAMAVPGVVTVTNHLTLEY